MSVLRFDNVSKQYAGGHEALTDVSFEVAPGEMLFVTGHSGAGKSTLLKLIHLDERPSRGAVVFDERNLLKVRGGDVPRHRRAVGAVYQDHRLLMDRSIAENVALPLRTHTRLPAAVLRRLVEMKLHAVGLLAAADAWPRELSGGMARRVALARALALDPPLMIYDEPLTGLDPIASGVIMSLIQRLNHSLGLTSIIVSHHVHETLPICDQVIAIANGGIVFQGTPEALQSSQDPLLRQFLHGQPDGPIPFDAAPRARVA